MILAMRASIFVLPFVLAAALPGLCPGAQKGFDEIARDADVARTADRLQDAIRLYRQGVDLRPSWQDGWWWLGSLYYDQDRFPEAQAAFTRFVAMAPKPGPGYAFLALSEYETHDYARAIEHFQKWALHGSPGTDALLDVAGFHWALLLTREGRFVHALYLLAAKAQKRGYSPALAEAMGLASLRMASLSEEYPPERREMVWLAGQAAVYASLRPHEFDRADEYARRLLLHYSEEPNVHYFRGTLFDFRKMNGAARQEYQEELRISPRHAPAMVELARTHLVDRQFDEAASWAKRATEIAPEDPVAHYVLGRALLATEHVEESVRELEVAVHRAPDSAPIRFQLATAYRKLGRKKEAEHEFAVFASLKNKPEVLISPAEREELQEEAPGQSQ
jgi:tetratricopeptide (TPR) repeat protein